MKNKFLKKSLAMLVAATMAVSALPMFAGAAGNTLGLTSAKKSSGGAIGENQAVYEANMNKVTSITANGNTINVVTNGKLEPYKGGTGSQPTQAFYGLIINLGITEETEQQYVKFAGGYTSDLDGSEKTDNAYAAAKTFGGSADGDMILWLDANKASTQITFSYKEGGIGEEQTTTVIINVKDSTETTTTATTTTTEQKPNPVTPTDPTTTTAVPTKPATPVKVSENAPVTVAPVIKGVDPDVAASLTLNVTEAKKDEGAGKTAFEAAAVNGAVLGFYEIKLTNPDGTPYVLKAGETLEMTFELGKEYANQKLVVRHYNSESGKHIKDYEVTADENGKVTIEVSELSFFAIQKSTAKSGNPKTGDSTQIFVLLSVLAVAGASVVLLRKRQLAK